MKIAQLGTLWKTIPPMGYGGTELVIHLLTETLVEQGHEVSLYACRGSHTKARLIEVIGQPMYDLIGGRFQFDAVQPYDLLAFKRAIDDAKDGKVDIIHSHLGHPIALLADLSPVPIVSTLHSSHTPDFPIIANASKNAHYVSISDSQRQLAPYLNYEDTIYHGIDVQNTPYSSEPGDYLLFVGTMGKEKGADRAIKIAKAAGVKLIMAGNIRYQSDFDELKPYIDGEKIVYLGEVTPKEKYKLMQGAMAFIFPIRWSEAFGLVVPEALAAGTPVIAWSNGSLPELIDDGKTGFLVESIAQAVKAIDRIPSISREHCRDVALRRFDRTTMARSYVELYERLIATNNRGLNRYKT
jgi:glycosyltransferase involved in cell wall biosynthesis